MYYTADYRSPVGNITLACEGEDLVGLWLEGQKYFGEAIAGEVIKKSDTPVLRQTKEWLDRYFAGEKPDNQELRLRPIGSSFRQDVWKIMREIPYGKTITYRDIACKIAELLNRESMSGQAVGGAVAHNPISIILPCHRVVGAGGSLTGYAGGLEVKVKLLKLEGADMTGLYLPGKKGEKA